MLLNSTSLSALTTTFHTLYDESFNKAEAQWSKVAMLVPSNSKDVTYGFLKKANGFRKWLGDRVIQNLSTGSYTVKNESFENTVAVSKDDIEDDNVGVYNPIFQNLGYEAAMHPDELVFGLLANAFTTLCYDGQYFIDVDHPGVDATGAAVSVSNSGGGAGAPWFLLDTSRPIKPLIYQKRSDYNFVSLTENTDGNVFNRKEFLYGVDGRGNAGFGLWQLAYGSKQTLDETNFNAGVAAMQGLKSDAGKPLGIKPTLLVVGPSNRAAALKLVNAENNSSGATNINRNLVEVLVCPWLT